MAINPIIEKYCGDAKLNDEMVSLAIEVETVENQLRAAARQAQRLSEKILANLDAKKDDRVYQLNSTGEVNGSAIGRIDVLVMRRELAIRALQREAYRAANA